MININNELRCIWNLEPNQPIRKTAISDMPSLDALPQEIILHIYSFLPHDALAQLALVSKRLGPLAETSIWNDIELHEVGYHESSCELKEPPPVVAPWTRRYHTAVGWRSRWVRGHSHRLKAASLFWRLEINARANLERTKMIASRARSLCTVLDWMNKPEWVDSPTKLEFTWNIFPLFQNLERLELHGEWQPFQDGYGTSFDKSAAPLPQLRFLKLFGYFPQRFVKYLLRSSPTLERLELGVLDAPVGSTLWSDGKNPRSQWRPEGERDETYDMDDADSLDDEDIAPRPMPLFPDERVPEFPRLKHLHLCKPSMCDPEHYGIIGEVAYSGRAEEASLSDWSGLLEAVQENIETLVLEHRVLAEYIEGDAYSQRDFIKLCSHGPAEANFMKRVMPVFQKQPFPKLQKVFMLGLLVSSRSTHQRSAFKELWQDRTVPCIFKYGQWCFFDSTSGLTHWASFDGCDEDDEEDNDDGDAADLSDDPVDDV